MLRLSQNKAIKHPYVYYGSSAVLDEDWDELSAPPLVTSTCFEQFEGHGRNEPYPQSYFTRIVLPPPAARNLYRPVWNPLPKPPRKPNPGQFRPAVIRRPDPEPEPEPLPRNTEQSRSYWEQLLAEEIRRHHERQERERLSLTLLPIHPLCYICGYRKGGTESWDGHRCKCGWMAAPIVSPNGNYFYG
jgi:hypothetical protein